MSRTALQSKPIDERNLSLMAQTHLETSHEKFHSPSMHSSGFYVTGNAPCHQMFESFGSYKFAERLTAHMKLPHAVHFLPIIQPTHACC